MQVYVAFPTPMTTLEWYRFENELVGLITGKLVPYFQYTIDHKIRGVICDSDEDAVIVRLMFPQL